jgi:hypothetical protein
MSHGLVVQSGFLEMEILPELAGRVAALRAHKLNVLSGSEAHSENWGATFWTSPQADWGWPPVPEIDALPYGVIASGSDGISLRSRVAEFGGKKLVVEKHFRPAPHGCIDTEYVIENRGAVEFRMSSWEISRVEPGGLTFYPTGESEITPVAPHFELATEKFEGTTFYDHAGFEVGKCRKLHADGRGGYLAHLMGRQLLLKMFEDSVATEQAPGEGECEIFANDDGKYIEIEVQGRYALIAPGSRSSFLVRTAILPLSPGLTREDKSGLRKFADQKVATLRP